MTHGIWATSIPWFDYIQSVYAVNVHKYTNVETGIRDVVDEHSLVTSPFPTSHVIVLASWAGHSCV